MSSSWSRTLLIAFSKSVYAMTSMVGSFEKIPDDIVGISLEASTVVGAILSTPT
ncbi:MAG: hypothetical protein HN492_01850 [Porticoccus sp.]|nr:hypothetical protein [Porticoccus sp.]